MAIKSDLPSSNLRFFKLQVSVNYEKTCRQFEKKPRSSFGNAFRNKKDLCIVNSFKDFFVSVFSNKSEILAKFDASELSKIDCPQSKKFSTNKN